jgi:hypothetical protein
MQRRVTLSVPARAALLAIPAGLDIDATPASPSAGMPTSLASQKVLGASVLIVAFPGLHAVVSSLEEVPVAMEVVAGGTSVVDTTIVSLLLLPLTLSPSGVTTTGGPSGAATLPMVVVELQDQPLSVVALRPLSLGLCCMCRLLPEKAVARGDVPPTSSRARKRRRRRRRSGISSRRPRTGSTRD